MNQEKLIIEPFIPISTPTCVEEYECEMNKDNIITSCKKRCTCPAFIS